ncbi:MAG: glycosyltransferase family 9 protein [Ignavibacteriae bacterium]|uniref:glycosyltransferase family 9 protein n=1 Tax=Mariniflexile maritimum TaxID=2682493 RepID=UPI0012F6CF8A|nr:glycosyltransferase family 9 protein [Mariniflexile maritimum]MCB0743789.1 glycosyltransferase family 9 protein [Ignavibacteriota bacterium]HMR15017.1 glycosyltransferase family 9 protein [Mariniflexile sp.]
MKILIIQQKMIGDVLLSTMLCEQIKKNIPTANIHYLINLNTEAVVTNNPYIDSIIFFTEDLRNSKWLFYRFLEGITQEKYDVVIDAYGKLESILVSLFSMSNIKISMDKWYSRTLYTKTFKYRKSEDCNLGLAVENRLKLLKPLIGDIKEIANPPKIYLTNNEILNARSFLEKNNINFSNPIIMINILGSTTAKTYPLTYMAEIIEHITSQGEFTLLFNYMPSQLKQAEELYNICSSASKSKIKFNVYVTQLRNFLGILYHCNALLGNEGGAINMAKGLNVPTFSIFSPWVEKETWETFKYIKYHEAVHLKDYQPLLITGKSTKKLRNDALYLYSKFKPSLFKEKINYFLDKNISIRKPNSIINLSKLPQTAPYAKVANQY